MAETTSHCCTSCLPHPKKPNTLSHGTLLSGLMPSYAHAQTLLLVFDSFHRHKWIAIVITFVVIKFKNSWRSIVPPSLLPVFVQSARIKVNERHGTRRNICDICNKGNMYRGTSLNGQLFASALEHLQLARILRDLAQERKKGVASRHEQDGLHGNANQCNITPED